MFHWVRDGEMKPTWTVEQLHDLEDILVCIDKADAAFDVSPLLSRRFLEPILEIQYGRQRQAYVASLVSPSSERPHVLAILVPRRFGVWETLSAPQAPLGLVWEEQGFDWVPHMPGLLAQLPGVAMLAALLHQDMRTLPDDLGPYMNLKHHLTTGAIQVTGDFEDYWAERPAKYRRNISNRYNRLSRDGIETRLDIVRAPADMAAAVDDYGRMESAGWKGRADTAVHPENAQGEMYRRIMHDFALDGEAIAFQYFLNDELAATDLALSSRGQLIFLKTTYAETLSAYSPSQLMRREIFEWVFAEKLVDRIEFYGRVQDRHRALCTDFWDIGHLNIYRLPLLMKLHQALR